MLNIIDNRKKETKEIGFGDYFRLGTQRNIYVITNVAGQWIGAGLQGGYFNSPKNSLEELIDSIYKDTKEIWKTEVEFISGDKVKIDVTIL